MTPEDFIRESNRIEGILRAPTHAEIGEYQRFVALDDITIEDLQQFVSVYQPGAVLRDKKGLNVRVGDHIAPLGAPAIRTQLEDILNDIGNDSPYETHVRYEMLHPFTDGNGRSGRMLWLWCMGGHTRLGFLHHWYYQSLSHARQP